MEDIDDTGGRGRPVRTAANIQEEEEEEIEDMGPRLRAGA